MAPAVGAPYTDRGAGAQSKRPSASSMRRQRAVLRERTDGQLAFPRTVRVKNQVGGRWNTDKRPALMLREAPAARPGAQVIWSRAAWPRSGSSLLGNIPDVL